MRLIIMYWSGKLNRISGGKASALFERAKLRAAALISRLRQIQGGVIGEYMFQAPTGPGGTVVRSQES